VPGFREGRVAFKRHGEWYVMFPENDTRVADCDVVYGMASSPVGPFSKPALNPILKKDTCREPRPHAHYVGAIPNVG
jgi:hypothetical protein